MSINNNKGVSLVEILVTTAIIAIVMPMITSIMINGIQDYVSGTKYVAQQDQINGIYQTLRSDHQKCREIIAYRKIAPEPTLPPKMSNTIEVKYDNKDHNLVSYDLSEEPLDKIYEFEDVPNSDSDKLWVTTSESGVGVRHIMMDNILVRLASSPMTDKPKSGIYFYSDPNPDPDKKIWKIWMEIWFNDINTEFFKSRNYSAPVIIYFDTANKKFTNNF